MLEGWEWLIIGVVAIVIILWGPAKIPEFAKALGRAKGEFNNAQKEFTDAATRDPFTPVQTVLTLLHPQFYKQRTKFCLKPPEGWSNYAGQNAEQISDEISCKVKLLSTD